MNITRRMAAIGALALACAGLSLASSVTYNTSFSATTDFTNGLLSLPEFNNTTGALAGMQLLDVSLSLTVVDTVTSLSLTNNSASAQTFSAQSYVYVDDCDTSSSCTTGNPAPVGIGPSVADEDQVSIGQLFLFNKSLTLGPLGAGTCPVGTPSVTCNSVSYTPPNIVKTASGTLDVGISFPSDISKYIGTSNFSETAETDTFTSTGGAGGNVLFNQATTATIFAYVTYTYQVPGAPEPATLFLMGTALVGVGLLRKRIKS